ncbi:hypothetical protein GN244_ATG05036 [Phytophthora infestans]|uniref:Transmembrane protein n=1 Tax=Phytophthora infestans TaxID=4787 RepID=A0A833TG23_PHYIN|nr:hypothetical protein GN244_ATG05036 [Phytophthora infestans]
MAKKRRHVAAPHRATATASREVSVDHEAMKKSLESFGANYDQLRSEVTGISASLERTLLLQSLVALVLQNVLMVVQSVSTTQIAVAVGTAVWMTRERFVEMFLPPVSLRVGSGREVLLRSLILVLAIVGLGAVFYRVEIPPSVVHLVAFAAVFLLDLVSIYLSKAARGRLARPQILLAAVEVTHLVAGLSISLNYKQGWIYDEMAFALTAATAFVHVVVLLTAKYIVLYCFGDMNGAFMETKQRGAKLMERVWIDIDRFEPEQLLVGASKKKKAKNKSRTSSSKTVSVTAGNDKSALPKKQSVFKEPRVQLAVLTLVQILLLLSQLVLSVYVLHSWEMISVLMLSSSHVLWTLGQVRRKVLSRKTITSADQKL